MKVVARGVSGAGDHPLPPNPQPCTLIPSPGSRLGLGWDLGCSVLCEQSRWQQGAAATEGFTQRLPGLKKRGVSGGNWAESLFGVWMMNKLVMEWFSTKIARDAHGNTTLGTGGKGGTSRQSAGSCEEWAPCPLWLPQLGGLAGAPTPAWCPGWVTRISPCPHGCCWDC